MKPAAADISLSDIKSRLRTASLRATGPRITVMRYLLGRDAPVSHAELAHDLETTGLDRATLYRNLMDLHRAGMVSRRDLGDHVWRFELQRQGDDDHDMQHPHFFCTACGEVRCLPDVHVTIVGDAPNMGTALQRSDVQLRGRCERC